MTKLSTSKAFALVEALLGATLRNKKDSFSARMLAGETLAVTSPETALAIVAEGTVPEEICQHIHALLDLGLAVTCDKEAA